MTEWVRKWLLERLSPSKIKNPQTSQVCFVPSEGMHNLNLLILLLLGVLTKNNPWGGFRTLKLHISWQFGPFSWTHGTNVDQKVDRGRHEKNTFWFRRHTFDHLNGSSIVTHKAVWFWGSLTGFPIEGGHSCEVRYTYSFRRPHSSRSQGSIKIFCSFKVKSNKIMDFKGANNYAPPSG